MLCGSVLFNFCFVAFFVSRFVVLESQVELSENLTLRKIFHWGSSPPRLPTNENKYLGKDVVELFQFDIIICLCT